MAKGLKTGGRRKGTPNKNTADLKALASKHGPAALKAIRVLADTAENEQTRLAAWRELLDRGYGKPAQYNEIGGGAPLRLIVETGVPLRAVEPAMVDITPDSADIEPTSTSTLSASAVPQPADINGFDHD